MSDHRHTVLIVDDDAMMRDALAALIEQRGYNAVAVDGGQEALKVLRGGLRPCAILLDLVMPLMSGFAFRRAQLADPQLAAIPVLVVSGGGYVNEAKARKLGMRVFFRKPMDLDAFTRALHEHCGVGKAA
jgi:CheY-like chemotaxis protein